jgi:multiple sugar transport system substrate-binding protein
MPAGFDEEKLRSALLSRRSILIGSAAAAGTFLLAACSSPAPTGGDAGAASGAPADLAISWWGSDDRHQKTLALLKLYSQKHPEVTFQPTYGGLVGYQDKMVTEFSGGNGPDVMQVADKLPFIAGGQFLQLDKYVKDNTLDLSKADQKTIDAQKIDGKLYTLPWGLAAGVMFYDTKVFSDAGIKGAEMAWTWDTYREVCQTIVDATPDGFYGSADIWAPAGTGAWAPFTSLLMSRNLLPYSDDGKKLAFEKAQLKEWFSFWDDMRKDGLVTPADITALEAGFETSPLISGKAAIYPINSSIASSLQGLAKNPLGITTLPTGAKSTKYLKADRFGQYINASLTLAANSKSKNPQAVVDFMNFMINDPDANKITLMARGVPMSSEMVTLVTPLVSPVEKSMIDSIAYIQKNAVADVPAPPVADGQIGTLFGRSHQSIAFEQASIDDTVDSFFTEANRLLGQ